MSKEALGLIARAVSTVMSSTYFGCSLYGCMVSGPARKLLGSAAAKIESFQSTYKLSAELMFNIFFISFSSGMFGWYVDKDPQAHLILGSNALLVINYIFSGFFVRPINNALLDEGAKKKEDKWVNEQLDSWACMNNVRTTISLIAATLGGMYWAQRTL